MAQEIRYFGSEVAYGEDCQPLAPSQGIFVTEESVRFSESMTASELAGAAADLRPPVSYIVLPF